MGVFSPPTPFKLAPCRIRIDSWIGMLDLFQTALCINFVNGKGWLSVRSECWERQAGLISPFEKGRVSFGKGTCACGDQSNNHRRECIQYLGVSDPNGLCWLLKIHALCSARRGVRRGACCKGCTVAECLRDWQHDPIHVYSKVPMYPLWLT